MSQIQISKTHEIDVRALACPMPIIKVSSLMKQLTEGDVLKVSAKGDGTIKDLSAFCARTGDQMIEHTKHDEELTFFIRKS